MRSFAIHFGHKQVLLSGAIPQPVRLASFVFVNSPLSSQPLPLQLKINVL